MGVSISIHIYDKDKLVDDIHNWVVKQGGYREGAHDARSFLEIVGPEFGILSPTEFTVLWNEYYEDYNAGTNFLNAVDEYFFPGRDKQPPPEDKGYWDSFWSSSYTSQEGSEGVQDVLEKVFPQEFGEDGPFYPYNDDY